MVTRTGSGLSTGGCVAGEEGLGSSVSILGIKGSMRLSGFFAGTPTLVIKKSFSCSNSGFGIIHDDINTYTIFLQVEFLRIFNLARHWQQLHRVFYGTIFFTERVWVARRD
ncbi:hypothetical protein HYU92_04885 [Candidatus Curtissbacteria bacterium]|nr:hypothetical protein [Candidatus Curtissbacteria bacterium]